MVITRCICNHARDRDDEPIERIAEAHCGSRSTLTALRALYSVLQPAVLSLATAGLSSSSSSSRIGRALPAAQRYRNVAARYFPPAQSSPAHNAALTDALLAVQPSVQPAIQPAV